LIQVVKAHDSLAAFRAQELTTLRSPKTIEDLSDQQESLAAADMLVRFEASTNSLHRVFSDFTSHAQQSLEARGHALHALSIQLKSIADSGTTCASPDSLQAAGRMIALADRAEEKRLISMEQAWSASADGMSRIVSILVDGGLLLHAVHLAARMVQQESFPPHPEARSLLSVEAALRGKLKQVVGELLGKVSQGFQMSHQLLQLWSAAGVNPPKEDKQMLDSAWSKASRAVQELQQSLHLRSKPTAYHELLLKAAKAGQSSLSSAFPAPHVCSHDADTLALWQIDAKNNVAWLLKDSGLYVTCNLSTGALGSDAEKPDRAELGSSLTSFLDSFHGWGVSQ
jgi:hypothetical protein